MPFALASLFDCAGCEEARLIVSDTDDLGADGGGCLSHIG
jgi:hypothetical protein